MMIGRLKGLSKDFDGSQIISVAVTADFREAFDELKDKVISVDIRPWKKHRSLEANAFAWSLIGKITAKMQDIEPEANWTPEKIYQQAIRDIGGIYTVQGIKTEAVPTFRRNWTRDHIGRQVEVLDGSSKEGWSNVRVWYGSSDFDTAQMSRFISSLIQDAESLGIPTLTDKEVSRMLGNWQKRMDKDKEEAKEAG